MSTFPQEFPRDARQGAAGRQRSSAGMPKGVDRAMANLLSLVRHYMQADLCEECEERVSANLCGQLQVLAASQVIGDHTRQACLDLMDHWLVPAAKRRAFGASHSHPGSGT